MIDERIKEHSIVIARVHHEDRPVFVLWLDNGIISAFKITTRFGNKSAVIQKRYFEIKDWLQSNLYKPSYIDTINIKELKEDEYHIRFVGQLSSRDERRFEEFLTGLD